MKTRLPAALTLLLLLALPQAAAAVCLGCSCTVSTTAVAFGSYNPLSASPVDSTGNVRVRCTTTLGLLVTLVVDLSKGSYSTVFSPRRMASGTNRLDYDLYTSSARGTIWGDGTSGTGHIQETVTLSLLGAVTRDYPVYGRIPGSQTTVRPGSYGDTVVVTVSYN